MDPRFFGGKRSARVGLAVNPRGSAVLKESLSAAAFEFQSSESGGAPGERRIPEAVFGAVWEALEASHRSKLTGALAQPKKARALPRTPWEERLGDLSEVLAWKKEFYFRARRGSSGKYPHSQHPGTPGAWYDSEEVS